MSEIQNYLTRRTFLGRTSCGLGAAALSDLFASSPAALAAKGAVQTSHPAKAIGVIYLHMSGGPSQLDSFDPIPGLSRWVG